MFKEQKNQNYTDIKKYYAGIGSRKTPEHILKDMTYIAKILKEAGYILNSGGAPGADETFELGAGDQKQIFVPWNGFQNKKLIYPIHKECYEIAKPLHPAWDKLSDPIKALMARNTMQVLGKNLNEPVEFTLCWTPDGCISHEERTYQTGGTGLAISVSSKNNIPVFNLADEFHYNFVFTFLTKLI